MKLTTQQESTARDLAKVILDAILDAAADFDFGGLSDEAAYIGLMGILAAVASHMVPPAFADQFATTFLAGVAAKEQAQRTGKLEFPNYNN